MGIYVNPITGQTKSEYLADNGTEVNKETVENFVYDGSHFPVFLVDNGPFDAAAVAFDSGERDYFLNDASGRPIRYFIVPREYLGDEAGLGDTMNKW